MYSIYLSVRLSITRVDQSKTMQARITKSLLSAARKTLVLGGSLKLSINSKRITANESAKCKGVGKILILSH